MLWLGHVPHRSLGYYANLWHSMSTWCELPRLRVFAEQLIIDNKTNNNINVTVGSPMVLDLYKIEVFL